MGTNEQGNYISLTPRSLISLHVRQDVRRQLRERIGTRSWLRKGVWFRDDFSFSHRLSEQAKQQLEKVFVECDIPDRRENRQNFNVLLVNLLLPRNKRCRPVNVSMNMGRWTRNQYRRTTAGMPKIIRSLKEKEFLNMRKGYYNSKHGRIYPTRIWATEKLLEWCPELPQTIIFDPVELVILRDSNGRLKEYKNTAYTIRLRRSLQEANQVNLSAEIRHLEYRLYPYLHAIYREDFQHYGRLHTRGYRHVQRLSKGERAEITINGDPVVELDFSGLHPYLLYAADGIQFSGDPYKLNGHNGQRVVRKFLKKILMYMINSSDFATAEKAANNWRWKHHQERYKLRRLGITRARPLMEALLERHQPIAHYLCSEKKTGLKVMNKDARIALDIVLHFIRQDIPALPIHDSFIVQAQHKEELRRVMKSIYKEHTNGFEIEVKTNEKK